MKKISTIALAFMTIFTMTACNDNGGSSDSTSQVSTTPQTTTSTANKTESGAEPVSIETEVEISEETETDSNILVAYFSMPETTNPDNMTRDEDNSTVVIDGEVLGNTQYVAYIIEEHTNADIFRIEPKTPYPTDHDTLVDLADKEQKEGARPELLANVENINDYDVIFLGYPNWWADMPMILYSFLENVDLSGKTIIPFNTHGGSGFSDTINTIAGLQTNATVEKNGFTVSRNNVASAESDVLEWLKKLGY